MLNKDSSPSILNNEVGAWKVLLKTNTPYEQKDLEGFLNDLVEFEMEMNEKYQMLRVHVLPLDD